MVHTGSRHRLLSSLLLPLTRLWNWSAVHEIRHVVGSIEHLRGLLKMWVGCLLTWLHHWARTRCFPVEFKEAFIQPFLKRDGLNLNDLKNCRPVSNSPPFLSKLLERVVQARLLRHLDGNSLLPGWQSAYCWFHSTETAVTKVFSDLLMAVDRGRCLFSVFLIIRCWKNPSLY